MKQLSITNNSRNCAKVYVPSVASDSEILTHSPSESQARVLIRKDGKPDGRTGNGRPFMAKQSWQIFGDVAVALVESQAVLVDAGDVQIVAGHRWYVMERHNNFYAATGQGILMHRLLMGLRGPSVDHFDNNGLNNRRGNLRLAGQSNNAANRRKHKAGTSTFKGVFRRAGQHTWCASITKTIDGVKTRFNLGHFTTEELAAAAYDAKAVELFGSFAKLNFPLTPEQSKAA